MYFILTFEDCCDTKEGGSVKFLTNTLFEAVLHYFQEFLISGDFIIFKIPKLSDNPNKI